VAVQLRTAGLQIVRITDPTNVMLDRICTYRVHGPLALRSNLVIPDPYTSTDEETPIRPFLSLPANAGPFTLTNVAGPEVDTPGGLAPLGTLLIENGFSPGLLLAWNPDDAPAGTVTCTKLEPCNVNGPRTITFTLTDEFGNESAGSIALKVFTNLLLQPPKINIDPPTGGLLVGESYLAPLTTYSATVAWTNESTTGLQLNPSGSEGDVGGVIATVTPTGSAQLVTGADVQVTILETKPVVSTCIPTDEQPCEKGNFAEVQIIYGGPELPEPDYTTVDSARTIGFDTCGVYDGTDNTCPSISFLLPLPPAGFELTDYAAPDGTPHALRAVSTDPLDEITFKIVFGKLPDGLTLATDGTLSGQAAQGTKGLYTITWMATGSHSGANRTIVSTIEIK
jgi:hypothetical protein